ncbi:MAG: exodeoxyribonuclease V subunit alpha [Bacteroidales bacterium]|nr:exodeoxyribonuclease V subunit alpha [Bacteroidales bacterium]
MNSNIDIHLVFANYFEDPIIQKVAYSCSEKLFEGHICVSIDSLLETHEDPSIDALLNNKWIGNADDLTKPFIKNGECLYMQRYYLYETAILDKISNLISSESASPSTILNDLVLNEKMSSWFSSSSKEPDWQLVAVLMALQHHFSIITGGPGTGKTTTIAKLLGILYSIDPKLKIALAAPTGKAAVRIKESLIVAANQLSGLNADARQHFESIPSTTIHRLLGARKGTHRFKHDATQPLPYDWVIVDESSMIGVSLMSKLMDAIPDDRHLILLGDQNQLAAVEAGSLLGDMCMAEQASRNKFSLATLESINQLSPYKFDNSYSASTFNILTEHIVELQKSYRFDSKSAIGILSAKMLNNQLNINDLMDLDLMNDKAIVWKKTYSSVDFNLFYPFYEAYIKAEKPEEALILFQQIRVLCPTHEGEFSVEYFNASIEQYLKQRGLIHPNAYFYEHRPVMITQNDYQLNLFNGDIGIVRYNDQKQLKVYFEIDGQIKPIDPSALQHFETVFAMTIHKSQGSEFERVALIIPQVKDSAWLSRELIYTGITRAKKQLFLMADASVLLQASQLPNRNVSGITKRLA